MIHDIYDFISFGILVLALLGTVLMIHMAHKHRTARVIFWMVGAFCFYFTAFYTYLLLCDPLLSISTAAFARVGIILLLAGIIMLGLLLDKLWTLLT
jgi:hypothetical protein